ncbi:MAG: hypothetical protein M0011_13490 [Elusimicrobia bacterium]|nr:hypothetical protein [Elusimicrobiota bacterium]
MEIRKFVSALLASLALSAAPTLSSAGAFADLGGYGFAAATVEMPRAVAPAGSERTVSRTTLRLADFTGGTFVDFMTAGNGFKAALDQDALRKFSFTDMAGVKAAAAEFDPLVYSKIVKAVKGGEEGLGKLADSLAGETATSITAPAPIAKKVQDLGLAPASKIGLTAVVVSPLFSLASGAGVTVVLDNNNYFLNIGYKSGSDPAQLEKDVKSGRSFGASPVHKPLDVTDKYYLQEMHDYLSAAGNPARFYWAMMKILTNSDPSGLAYNSVPAQGVLSDFTAVYAAELDRYIMTGFRKHPWQNDLAEATLIAAYSSPAARVVVNGKFVEGNPVNFFGVGKNGSGIGICRKDRRQLQLAIVNFERAQHPELVSKVEELIGRRGGDLIHNLMLFINKPDKQAQLRNIAEELTDAVTALMTQVHADAPEITMFINRRGLPLPFDADAANDTQGHDAQ